MIDPQLHFVPAGGFDAAWLKNIYLTLVSRSRAIGKDGVRPRAFLERLDDECELITKKVDDGSYQFTNYREKLIARGAQRHPRQISIPTIRDRLALRGALEFLKANFPAAQPRPPHVFIKEIKTHLATARAHSSFLRMDIRDFYPSLRHDLLTAALKASPVPESIILLIMKAVSTRTGSSAQPAPTIGVPQGLSISNALAAIYMIEFDKTLGEEVFYRRYVDDILAIDHSEKINSVYEKLWQGLDKIHLNSHPMGTAGKTEVKMLDVGVQYLGYEISPSKVSIRQSSLSRMFSNLSKVITCFKYQKQNAKHLFRLNLKITGCVINNSRRGWLMFFSQTDNVSQLAYLDEWLKSQLEPYKIEKSQIKSFKKSYYEIRYNLKATEYIPNFDKYDLVQKRNMIVLLSKRTPEEVDVMDIDIIEQEFNRLIGKEISELERDLIEAFS